MGRCTPRCCLPSRRETGGVGRVKGMQKGVFERAADKVRDCAQLPDRQGARPDHPGNAVGDRRRGDPVGCCAAQSMSQVGQKPPPSFVTSGGGTCFDSGRHRGAGRGTGSRNGTRRPSAVIDCATPADWPRRTRTRRGPDGPAAEPHDQWSGAGGSVSFSDPAPSSGAHSARGHRRPCLLAC
jgi:hypothetical protein